MLLKQLIQDLNVSSVEGPLDREITGLTYDSRRVTPGMVFVAIPGHHVDGHEFILAAVDRGAIAVVCEQNGFVAPRATKIKVSSSRVALARAAAAYYDHPSTRLKVIGITGTNGKTTVSFMVKQILETAGIRCGLIGTVRYEIGDRILPAQRTTPEALEIQQMLAQMLRADCQACVMEVSSHALDQGRVLGVDFDVAIFTNLSRDHLDYHQTIAEYFAAKQRLFKELETSAKQRTAVINIDDSFGAQLATSHQCEVQLTYGVDHTATLRATRIELGSAASRLRIETPAGDIECRLPLIGRHNIYNALAAVGAGLAIAMPIATLRRALDGMRQVPGRLESVLQGQPFGVYVDYAHTEDALRNVLTTLQEISSGRLLLAFGCGGNRDAGKRPAMGRAAAELANFTVITNDNPRKESAGAIAAQIEAGYLAARPDGYRVVRDRRDAIETLIRMAQPGDTVLLAGKGHETYQEFEDTVVPFDDRVYARQTLARLGWANS